MSGKKPSGKQAAIDILREHDGGPMPVKELVVEAAKRTSMKGKTPSATIAALIYTAAKKGETFQIVERGVVELIPDGEKVDEDPAADPDSPAVTPGSVVLRDGKQARPDPKPAGTGRRSRPKVAA